MFDNNRFITLGISDQIPVPIQSFMWQTVDGMDADKTDYLQVFDIKSFETKGHIILKVIHSQECPKYRKKYYLAGYDSHMHKKIFIIDDQTHSTMLLADEY